MHTSTKQIKQKEIYSSKETKMIKIIQFPRVPSCQSVSLYFVSNLLIVFFESSIRSSKGVFNNASYSFPCCTRAVQFSCARALREDRSLISTRRHSGERPGINFFVVQPFVTSLPRCLHAETIRNMHVCETYSAAATRVALESESSNPVSVRGDDAARNASSRRFRLVKPSPARIRAIGRHRSFPRKANK